MKQLTDLQSLVTFWRLYIHIFSNSHRYSESEGNISLDLGQCHWIMFTKSLQYFTFNLRFTLCFFISWTIRYLLTSLIQNVVPRAKMKYTNLVWLFYGKIRNLLSSLFSVMLSFAFVRKYCSLINKKMKHHILRTVFAEKILRC